MSTSSLFTVLAVFLFVTVIAYPWILLAVQFLNKNKTKLAFFQVLQEQKTLDHTKDMSMGVRTDVRLDKQMVTYLIKRNVGIDILKSKNFIAFKPDASVFEIRKIEAIDKDIFYTLERSQDGKRFVMHEDIVREFMKGVLIADPILKYAQE